MPYCTNCGTELPRGAVVCPGCNAHVGPPLPPGQARYPAAYQQPPSQFTKALPYIIGCPVLLFVGIAIVGILAAIAIPDFLKFQAKARQAEAKTSLQEIFTAQAAHFGENNHYGETFEQIGWAPAVHGNYAYYLGDDVIPTAAGVTYHLPAHVQSFVEAESFLAVAVGNVDNDDSLDVWTIDDSRELKNVHNDMTEF